jgi:hypothetical protein
LLVTPFGKLKKSVEVYGDFQNLQSQSARADAVILPGNPFCKSRIPPAIPGSTTRLVVA